MKIFSWIHLKFHPSYTNYSQVPHEKDIALDHGDDHEGEAAMREETTAAAEAEKETKALLLHDMLHGILTIGTLGHGHPLLPPSTYYSISTPSTEIELAKEDQARKGQEMPPAKEPAISAAAADQRRTEVSAVDSFKIESSVQENEVGEAEEIEKILELPLLMEEKKAKQVRTILADLFAADDASFNLEKSIKEVDFGGNCLHDHQAADGHPITKKEIRQPKKNNAEKTKPPNTKSTGKKLQKLITRMLKKKIHPEVVVVAAAAAAGTGKEAAKSSLNGDGRLLLTV